MGWGARVFILLLLFSLSHPAAYPIGSCIGSAYANLTHLLSTQPLQDGDVLTYCGVVVEGNHTLNVSVTVVGENATIVLPNVTHFLAVENAHLDVANITFISELPPNGTVFSVANGSIRISNVQWIFTNNSSLAPTYAALAFCDGCREASLNHIQASPQTIAQILPVALLYVNNTSLASLTDSQFYAFTGILSLTPTVERVVVNNTTAMAGVLLHIVGNNTSVVVDNSACIDEPPLPTWDDTPSTCIFVNGSREVALSNLYVRQNVPSSGSWWYPPPPTTGTVYALYLIKPGGVIVNNTTIRANVSATQRWDYWSGPWASIRIDPVGSGGWNSNIILENVRGEDNFYPRVWIETGNGSGNATIVVRNAEVYGLLLGQYGTTNASLSIIYDNITTYGGFELYPRSLDSAPFYFQLSNARFAYSSYPAHRSEVYVKFSYSPGRSLPYILRFENVSFAKANKIELEDTNNFPSNDTLPLNITLQNVSHAQLKFHTYPRLPRETRWALYAYVNNTTLSTQGFNSYALYYVLVRGRLLMENTYLLPDIYNNTSYYVYITRWDKNLTEGEELWLLRTYSALSNFVSIEQDPSGAEGYIVFPVVCFPNLYRLWYNPALLLTPVEVIGNGTVLSTSYACKDGRLAIPLTFP